MLLVWVLGLRLKAVLSLDKHTPVTSDYKVLNEASERLIWTFPRRIRSQVWPALDA